MHGPRSEARDLGHVDDVGPVVVGVVQHLRPRLRVRVREGGACVREREEEGEGKMEGAGEGVWGGMSERESEKAQAPSQ